MPKNYKINGNIENFFLIPSIFWGLWGPPPEKKQERTMFHRGAIIENQLSCNVSNWKYQCLMNTYA